ncbi:MAG: 3-hydroxyacyl-CoA dehydrogenase family protein, partial [Chitinophagaceae bacterium]
MIKNIAVIGCGTMGNGIAHVFALKGFSVHLVDSHKDALENGLSTIKKNMDRQIQKQVITPEEMKNSLTRIHPQSDLKEAVSNADLVIEAISEEVNIKLKLFQELDQFAPKRTFLASNTSSI